MLESIEIKDRYKDPVLDVVFDTIKQKRQALVFVSSKASAEKVATEIASKVKDVKDEQLAKEILEALPSPTKQCEKLASCALKHIAFHHAGLASKQKEIIEDSFRNNTISIIVCTPTLAAGVDLPAYRAIIRDVRRFSDGWGMQYIPVLEYQQMSGRAGRPGKETHGESIIICSASSEEYVLVEKFIDGEVEDIHSKLAVEPVLRTYVLSLIASEVITTYEDLTKFFDKTFYAHQFGDKDYIHRIIQRVLGLLRQWKMLESQTKNDFASALQLNENKLKATLLGKRVSELYLDPLTAHMFVQGFSKIKDENIDDFLLLQLMCSTLEARPLSTVTQKEETTLIESTLTYSGRLLIKEPTVFEPNYKDHLCSLKTALVLLAWTNEVNEEMILERFNVRPGELKAKTDTMVWLLTAAQDIARLNQQHNLVKVLNKLAIRIEYGVREELLTLLTVPDIGKVRARKLYQSGIKSIQHLRDTTEEHLTTLLGPATAKKVKNHVGNERILETLTRPKSLQEFEP